MAGVIRGTVDCFASTANAANNAQEMFKATFDHLERLVALGIIQRIASQYGEGVGAGTDYWDGANPFGEGSFVVYRWPATNVRSVDFYTCIEFSGPTSWSRPGFNDPSLIRNTNPVGKGSFGMSMASALEVDNVTSKSPWTGSTADDGTDRKGAVPGVGPVWSDGGAGSLFVFPMSNKNNHNAERQNVTQFIDNTSIANHRYGMVSDNDNLLLYLDFNNNLTTDGFWFGPIFPRGNLPAPGIQFPIGGLHYGGQALNAANPYGDVAGSAFDQGSFYHPVDGAQEPVWMTWLNNGMQGNSQPSEIQATPIFDEIPLWFCQADGLTQKGVIGMADPFTKIVWGVTDQSTSVDKRRVVWGANSAFVAQQTWPWDGATVPGTNFTRTGVVF